MRDCHRRTFLGVVGFAALSPRVLAGPSTPPSDRLRLGIIGLRTRGTDLAKAFVKNKQVEIVALSDIDDSMFEKATKVVTDAGHKAPRIEKDFRKLLDDKSIDAVAVSSPDHWHALMCVMACQAGKDVYTEKPVSHNVVEGRRMVEAARRYKRVVQAGTQRRSAPHIQEAIAHLHSGALGKVGMARAWIHQKRVNIGRGKPGPVPKGVDYDMWQGPAPDRPFMANRFHYNWHWFWNWGTGELGNNGIHGLDIARWGLNADAPLTVASGGGKYFFDDDQEVPDTQVVSWEFPNALLVWEHRMWTTHGQENTGFGIAFDGEKGTLIIDEKGWRVVDGEDKASGKPTDPMRPHIQNFVDCVQSRKAPNAEIEIGHLSTRLCHLGNIAQRTGRKLTFQAPTETFKDDKAADALLSREYSSRFEMPSQV